MIKKKIDRELVSVIVPAYNEGNAIKPVINDLLKLSKKMPLEIIVVDDGSQDDTAKIAQKAGAHKVISYKKNLGKGGAFKKGIHAAKGQYIVQIDADGQLLASEIPLLISPLQNGYDVTLGARYKIFGKDKSDTTSMINMSGNIILSSLATLIARRKITDVMTGFKAFKKNALLGINPQVSNFGYEAELVIKAAKKRYKIKTVLITCKKRIEGKSNLKIVKDGILVVKTMLAASIEK